jgi:mannose-1-phosphate guanylyltransferase
VSGPVVPKVAMIVAGGRGTRLLPFTTSIPKPMLPFCGAPFLEGVGRRLAAQGVQRLLLVVGADPAPFLPLIAPLSRIGMRVDVVPEPLPLDTAGGVRLASLALDEPFFVLNGDILSDLDVTALAAHHHVQGAAVSLALTRVGDTSAYGVCVLEGGRISAFVEKPAPGTLPGQDAINAGTYLIEPGVLESFPDGPLSFERTVFPELLERGRTIGGLVTAGIWSDLGTPERLLDGQRIVLDGGSDWPVATELVERSPGVHVAPSASIDPGARLVGPVRIGPGCVVAAMAQVGPHTVLEADVHIASGAHVSGSLLASGVSVGAHAALDRALVAAGARIGEHARLDAHAVLGPAEHLPAGTALGSGERRPPRDVT